MTAGSEQPRPDLRLLVTPSATALLVIDVQRDFCDPAFARRNVEATQPMLRRLTDLIAAARAAGVVVVTVRTEHALWSDSPAWLTGPRFGADVDRRVSCRPGASGIAHMPGFEPAPDDPIVTKRRYSGFASTDLDLILRSNGIRTVVISGVQTNSCCEATARDAFSQDYFVVFMSDATATYDEALHHSTLITMANHYGPVLTVAELTELWT